MGNAFVALRRALITERDGKAKIVISVPHAIGEDPDPKQKTHPRDAAAPGIAEIVASKLEAKGFDVVMFMGDTARDDMDYNRTPSRVSPWRKKLAEAMAGADMVLDIHSYPAWDREFDKYDSVIFTNFVRPEIRDHYLEIMGEPMNVLSYDCDMSPDGDGQEHTHDIIQEAKDLGVPAILLEFHDKWVEDPNKPAEAVVGATTSWLAEE